MTKLKPRDRKQEFQSRKARKTSLESTYGKLPEGWEKLNDEELKLYFSIQQRLEAGEIVPYKKSPFRISDWGDEDEMTSWLTEQKLMVTCPISSVDCIPNYTSIDEMARIPGFWPMIKHVFGRTHLFQALITSQKVQAMAMTDRI